MKQEIKHCQICGCPIRVFWQYNNQIGGYQVIRSEPDSQYVEHGLGWVCINCIPNHPPVV